MQQLALKKIILRSWKWSITAQTVLLEYETHKGCSHTHLHTKLCCVHLFMLPLHPLAIPPVSRLSPAYDAGIM